MGGGHRTEKFVLEGGDTAHTFLMSGTNGVGTPHNIERKHILGGGTPHIPIEVIWADVQSRYTAGWWLAQSVFIVPLCGSILQAETCQILSLAEYPRWSRVWQY